MLLPRRRGIVMFGIHNAQSMLPVRLETKLSLGEGQEASSQLTRDRELLPRLRPA